MRKILFSFCLFLALLGSNTAIFSWYGQAVITNPLWYRQQSLTVYDKIIVEASRQLFEAESVLNTYFTIQDITAVLRKSIPPERIQDTTAQIVTYFGLGSGDVNEVVNLTWLKTSLKIELKRFLIQFIQNLPPCPPEKPAGDVHSCRPFLDTSYEAIEVYIDGIVPVATLTDKIPETVSLPQSDTRIAEAVRYTHLIPWYIPGLGSLFVLLIAGILVRKKISRFFRGLTIISLLTAIGTFAWYFVGSNLLSFLEYSLQQASLGPEKGYLSILLNVLGEGLKQAFWPLVAGAFVVTIISGLAWTGAWWATRSRIKTRVNGEQ